MWLLVLTRLQRLDGNAHEERITFFTILAPTVCGPGEIAGDYMKYALKWLKCAVLCMLGLMGCSQPSATDVPGVYETIGYAYLQARLELLASGDCIYELRHTPAAGGGVISSSTGRWKYNSRGYGNLTKEVILYDINVADNYDMFEYGRDRATGRRFDPATDVNGGIGSVYQAALLYWSNSSSGYKVRIGFADADGTGTVFEKK